MTSRLTERQQEAVVHDGHLLIVAGPGSGKTSTSVAKATRILQDPRRSLLMVTFTKEAAQEMRKRLVTSLRDAGLRAPSQERLVVATFHSIAIQHLRRHGLRTRVLGPGAQNTLVRDAVLAAGVDKSEWGEVQKEFERVMYCLEQSRIEVKALTMKVVARYRQLLKATGQIDLFTVMRECALGVHEASLPPLHFTDMLVDEGQDTDELQRLWIFAHARAGCRVTIVGDDDQSIYEWRNALGFEGMRSFLATFRAHRIELGDNFRCRTEILGPAALLIGHNQQRLDKRLVARRGRGGAIGAFRAASSDEQYALLSDLIEATPDRHTNACVLARTNRSLDMMEIVLRARGIPYARLGKSIWEQPVIAGFLGLLTTLLDGSPSGLLPVLQARNVCHDVRCDLLTALGGNVSSYLDGAIPDLGCLDGTDKAVLGELARACTYWRRQLRAGAVREVILDVGDQYAGWMPQRSSSRLVQRCSQILADLRGSLSARLTVVSRKVRDGETAPVVLMTMHGAKGLEFQTVHIIDAHKNDDGSEIVRPEAERRLMYVAMTRARNCCVLWHSGDPHPAIAESAVVFQKTRDELLELVKRSG